MTKIIKNRIERQLTGEQLLARFTLDLLPVVEEVFQSFDGAKALIKTGSSAAFAKRRAAFRDAAEEVIEKYRDPGNGISPRCFVDSNRYSVYIKLDITLPTSEIHGGGFSVEYYKGSIYFGGIKDDHFKYDFARDEKAKYCHMILDTTLEKLEETKKDIKGHVEAIGGLEESIPYALRHLVKVN